MNARSMNSKRKTNANGGFHAHAGGPNRAPAFRLLPIATAVAAALTAPAGQAAFIDYVGPNGGFWDMSTNWTPMTPGNNPGDDVRLGAMDTTFRMNTVNIRSFTGTATLALTGGILNVSAASSTGGFNMSGGTLGGSGIVTVNGLATLTGGTQTGTGTTQFNGPLNINGNGSRELNGGRIMNTAGATTWTGNTANGGNSFDFNGSGTINNSGTWNDTNAFNTSLGSGNAGTKVFNNLAGATFNKSTGSGTTDINAAFNNNGTVNVNSGRLSVNGNVDSTSTGTFNIAAGSTLSFGNNGGSAGTATLNNVTFGGTGTLLVEGTNNVGAEVRLLGNVTHAGTAAVSSGTFQVDGNFAAAAYNQTGGQLSGSGGVTISGLATLTGGEQTGTGASQFNGPVNITGNGYRYLGGGRTMNTAGTTTWTGNTANGGNSFDFNGSGTINNSGTWNDTNAFNTSLGSGNAGTKVFNNLAGATFNKSTGSGTTDINAAFNNNGTVNVNSGRLSVNGNVDSTSTGTFNIAAGSTLSFGNNGGSAGTATLNNVTFGGTGTLLVEGTNNVGAEVRLLGNVTHAGTAAVSSGTFQVDGNFAAAAYNQTGGQLSGSGGVTISGLATLTGGEQTGTGASQFNGPVNITGNGYRYLGGGRTMNTAGTTTWTGNTANGGNSFDFNGSGTINNSGTWNDTNAFNTSLGSGNAGTKVFNNLAGATFNKSTGSGTTDINAAFNNNGTVNVNSGRLSVNGNVDSTSTGTFNIAAGSTLSFGNNGGSAGTATLNNVTFGGTGTLLVEGTNNVGAEVRLLGNVTHAGTAAVSSGTFQVDGNFAAAAYNQTGGQLSGSGGVTISGLATLTGGEQTGTGASQFNGPVNITGNGYRYLGGGRTMNTAGTTTWTGNTANGGNSFDFNGSGTINNSGTWNDTNAFNTSLGSGNAGTKVFNNLAGATFNKSTGSGTTDINAAFNNNGTVNVNSGRLSVNGNVDSTSTGTFNIAAGSTLSFGNNGGSAGTATLNNVTFGGTGTLLVEGTNNVGAEVRLLGNVTHAGTAAVSSGTFQVDGNFAAAAYNQTGGQLSGSGGVTISGLATLTGGEQTGTGASQFNGPVNITGNGYRYLGGGRTMNTAGTTTWTGNTANGGNSFDFNGSGTINNSGTWNDTNAFNTSLGSGNAGTKVFNNLAGATFNKSTGSGTTDINAAFNNNGIVNVSAGTMRFNNGTNGTGTLQTTGSGVITLATNNVSSTTGILSLASSAAPNLNLGNNNLVVSKDYDNAAFGSGNAFNKRANVSGSGVINGANVAQAITGATVTNGNNATANLTINNVRVGATTYNYQVANTGTGAALRGAIQPGANGGVISDSRLSGSGVSEGSFGPIAAGSSSGNYAVTFTAANAGALGPLNGTNVIHIANNFANVPEQNLVLSIGAGATAYNAAVGATSPSPVTVANQRVGGTASGALTVANTAPSGNFSEALNAGFSGTTGMVTNNGGSVSNLVAGGSNNGALAVGVNTATSGAKSGTVTIGYQTTGLGPNGNSGLAAAGAGSQTIGVSGNVYQTAAGTILTGPLNFGTVQVGQNVSQTLSIRNTATGASGFVEDLNASFGASSGTGASRITGVGSVNGLAAGSTSNGLMVGVDTLSAGTVNGSIAVNFFSAGAVGGVSNGLGTLAVGSAGYGVAGMIGTTGTVIDQAKPVVNNATIALGNVRIGAAAPTALVSVTNQATGNQQAALNATIAGNAPVTASGSFNLLAPGATNATSLAVGFDTSTAGSKNGTATISFVSDASNVGGCGAACQMALADQSVGVTGAVYRLANPTVVPSAVTVAGRVGSASPTTAINVTNASPDLYTEGLTVSRGATSSGFTSSGAITNLAAGGSSGAIGVTLNTTTAGTFSGTQALNYVSTGAGTTGAADLAIGSGSVALNGKVYTPAVAAVYTPSVDFGIVHVGDTATRGVSVTNAASTTVLNDVLVASAIGATGPFTASGSLAGLGAQQTSSALTVGLATGAVGTYSGLASFRAASHDADLSDAALTDLAISLSGQVNNYAASAFRFGSGAGTLSRSGSTYVLDYGTVAQGAGRLATTLLAANDATGPTDLLDGTFEFLDQADFGESGFSDFFDLGANQVFGPLGLAFEAMNVGSFADTIVLHGLGHNASGYLAAIGDIRLLVRGNVVGLDGPPSNGVSEPGSLLLIGLGVPLILIGRKRRLEARRPMGAARC